MIDLHCHTTASDGLLSPRGLVVCAKKEGITALAIADHDTVAGLDGAMDAAKDNGLIMAGENLIRPVKRKAVMY